MKVGDTIVVTAPEEPNDGSVVLDARGMVFQRWGEAWHAVDLAHQGKEWRDQHMNWPTLTVLRGPVVVLHLT
jgi:hypothetical protein